MSVEAGDPVGGLAPQAPERAGGDRPDTGPDRRARLVEVALLFARLGATAFGGPAAHIAMMEHEVVTRRRWVTREEFVDLLGATNLIPGPNSTELAIHLGHRRAGPLGLVVAGACFIVPAATITGLAAWAYARYRTVPALDVLLYGTKPAVLAIVGAAVLKLGRTTLRGALKPVVAAAAVAGSLLGVDELLILGAGAAIGLLAALARRPGGGAAGGAAALFQLAPAGGAVALPKAGLVGLFTYFLKVGSVLYGSGYVLIAFLRGGLVVDRGWITERELLDAVLVGQVTPGPVFSTATFVGYLVEGWPGAIVATLGIFLPAFVLVAATGRFVPRMRASRSFGGLLDGVNAAALGLMAAVVVQLGREALRGPAAWVIAALAIAAAARTRLNPTWIVLGGAAIGAAARALGAG